MRATLKTLSKAQQERKEEAQRITRLLRTKQNPPKRDPEPLPNSPPTFFTDKPKD